MSLFKTREFWSTQCDIDEKFDQKSLLVTNLNGKTDLIVIGSHNGILRIFNPQNDVQEGILTGYIPTDLILEKIFPEPILQIGHGRLVS